jgi:hypothetical protein
VFTAENAETAEEKIDSDFGRSKKMKKTYGTILVLSTATLVFLIASLVCWAAEKEEESIWHANSPELRRGWFELTDEAIEHMMERLKEANPERAKELEKLREKKPEQFKAELREIMREQFAGKFGEHRERIGGRGPGPREGAPSMERGGGFGGGRSGRGPGPEERAPFMGGGGFGEGRGMRDRERDRRDPDRRERTERWGERLRERYAEYLEWLEKNYPEEAQELAELKEAKPDLHMRQFWLSYRKYRRIFEASEENPKLVEVLKEDLELKSKRDKLLGKIRTASGDEKEELVKELKNVVSSRFDLIVKRKQIAYEQLRKELEELQERVKKSEAEVEKWKKVKSEKVNERLGELIGRTEKFNWH